MKHHITHFLKFVTSIILVISGSIVSCLEITGLSVPKLYDEGSKSLDRPGGRTLNSIPAKLDPAILAYPDGTVHFKEENSEKVLWSLPTGKSLYSSYRDGQGKFDYVDCGDNGELYWHTKHGGKMGVPVSIEQFISSTPHISEDGGVLLGSKNSTVFVVDAKSGRVIRTHGLSNSPIKMQSDKEKSILYDGNFGKLVDPGDMDQKNVERPIFVTRTDYSLEFFAPNSSKVLWKMTSAQIGAAFPCSQLGLVSQLDMPLPCQSEVAVHQYIKPSVLPESVLSQTITPQLTQLTDDKHLDSDRDNELLLAPASEKNSSSQPKPETYLNVQPNNNEVVVYQPPSEIENSGTSNSLDWRMYYVGLGMFPKVFAFLVIVVLVILGIGRYCGVNREEIELDKQSSNSNAKTLSSKRKKNRKSGKNNGSVEKKDRLLSSENEHGSAHIQSDSIPFLNLNRLDGDADGRRIGKLCVSSVEIAKGSNGTIVLEGIFEGRPVAVKRLVQTHHDVAFKEIQNLIASDRHPNIVRWYGVEYDQDFVYLSLERCTCSLDDLIQICLDSSQDEVLAKEQALKSMMEYKGRLDSVKGILQHVNLWKANGYPSPLLLQLMRDVVSGLVHLHDLGIIHRDLKPQNVLIIKERSLCAKLSDMGISRRLLEDMSSLGHHATGCGSSGWQAPEQLLHGRQTRAVDLFSLGCVLFFCITGGRHPFGDRLERDINIVKNQVDLFLVEGIPEAMDLFSHLLNPNPELRPKTLEVLRHPLFWSSEMRLSFLRDTSDRVELEDRETSSDILKALESIAPMALGAKWDEKMEPAFISNIGRYRRYKYDSVRDLLRVMRNKLNHYRELPKEIQELLGPIPQGFDEYFASRFPKLLIEVYKVVQRYCREDECFQKYFNAI